LRLSDFGFTEGINEVIVVTIGEFINTAPIGIIVENPESDIAKAKIYPSHTRENIEKGSKVYANITNDPIVFAISAFDDLSEEYFLSLNPPILKSALAYCEFDAKISGSYVELKLLGGRVISKSIRAVNRGFNALIEALVHATRYRIFKSRDLLDKILYYKRIVDKCGSKREREAFKILMEKIGLTEKF